MKTILKKLSVTIGIPAYNEESNIAVLLQTLKKQKAISYVLDTVLIVSDGSTDNTIKEVKKLAWEKTKVMNNKKRLGLNPTENIIIRKSKSDILLLLDADVLPEGNEFIESMIKPFYNQKNIGIVGADTVSLKGMGFIEEVFSKSHSFKKYMYKNINQGDNIYNCHGRARAFSKEYYSKIQFPKNCPEDAYSYLHCIKSNFEFIHAKNARVIFRSPTNLHDQIKQSKRFKGGKVILYRYFSKKLTETSFNIPVSVTIKSLLIFMSKHPIYALSYLSLIFYIRFINRLPSLHKIKYETSISTKKLMIGETSI